MKAMTSEFAEKPVNRARWNKKRKCGDKEIGLVADVQPTAKPKSTPKKPKGAPVPATPSAVAPAEAATGLKMNRKAVHSRAYHKTYKTLVDQGASIEDARAQARIDGKKATEGWGK